MRKIVAWLVRAVRSLEHSVMGDAETIVSPLTKIHEQLTTLSEDAGRAADRAYMQGSALQSKALAAAKQAENIGKVLGR